MHPFTAVADGDRQAIYDALVLAGPVHRMPGTVSDHVWMVTGYEAARAALADPRIVKGRSGVPFTDQLPPEVTAAVDQHLLALNPPDHGRLRRLVSAVFTRRRAEQLAPRIQQLTDGLLDHLVETAAAERARTTERPAGGCDGGTFADDVITPVGSIDLVHEFAYPLPITVICELLGIPEHDRDMFRGWTGPLVAGQTAGAAAYCPALIGMVGYLRDLLERKRREPGDDLLSGLVAVHDEGDRLTENELTSMVFLLLLAGHETTVNLIANAVRALLTHPDQLALLRAEPERIEAAVEELLRFDGPLQSTFPATAAVDVEIAGTLIPAGDVVLISLLAANRDPARHPDADQLDLARPDLAHLAFGHGIHHCLGAPLARLEARIALGSLITRFPDLRLAVPVTELRRSPGLLMNSLAELPVLL